MAHPQSLASGDEATAPVSPVRRKGSFAQTLKAVAWSFFGVRKVSDHEKDVTRINPVHVIIAGVLAAALFVALLLLLVDWVLSSGVAR